MQPFRPAALLAAAAANLAVARAAAVSPVVLAAALIAAKVEVAVHQAAAVESADLAKGEAVLLAAVHQAAQDLAVVPQRLQPR